MPIGGLALAALFAVLDGAWLLRVTAFGADPWPASAAVAVTPSWNEPVPNMSISSAPATRAEAPPPKPLNRPTSWGISVVSTVIASQTPMAAPTSKPANSRIGERMSVTRTVTPTASAIPPAEMRLPRGAVRGWVMSRSPWMNRTPATR